jgi:hypothetical protein
MTNTNNTNAKAKVYNITGTISAPVENKTNTNGKPYTTTRITSGDRTLTIMTSVLAGINALKSLKQGDQVRIYGTYTKSDKGQTFSMMGLSPERPVAAPAAA